MYEIHDSHTLIIQKKACEAQLEDKNEAILPVNKPAQGHSQIPHSQQVAAQPITVCADSSFNTTAQQHVQYRIQPQQQCRQEVSTHRQPETISKETSAQRLQVDTETGGQKYLTHVV